MQPFLPVPGVTVNLDCIARNFSILAARAGQDVQAGATDRRTISGYAWPEILPRIFPVVKADAYGHGHVAVGKTLLRAGAAVLCSSTIAESMELREALREFPGGEDVAILALLGAFSTEEAAAAAQARIVPVVHCFEQLAIIKAAASRPALIAIKCNSGMNRLGFSWEEFPALLEALKALEGVKPALLLSHLATADVVDDRGVMREQAKLFARMADAMRQIWPQLPVSLGNSAGTLLYEEIADIIGVHSCRPGLALYGCNPFAGTIFADRGAELVPAMQVAATIIGVREVKQGCGLGYGHDFIAPQDMRVGVIAAGYADGVSRGLSGKGEVCIAGRRALVLGRVSMQMTAVELHKNSAAVVGDLAWIVGGEGAGAITVEDVARVWGTISYEVLCLLGKGKRAHFSSSHSM